MLCLNSCSSSVNLMRFRALEDAINNEARRKMLVERFSAMHESLLADTDNLAADVIVGMARH